MATIVSPATAEAAMLRTQARVNPTLLRDLRDDLANFHALRRRTALQLTGELAIPTRATPAKLRANLAELDRDIADLSRQVAVLSSTDH